MELCLPDRRPGEANRLSGEGRGLVRGVVWAGVLAEEEEGAGDRGSGEEEASESWRRWDRRGGGGDWNGTCWSAVGRAGTSIGFMKWASSGSTEGEGGEGVCGKGGRGCGRVNEDEARAGTTRLARRPHT